MTEALPAEFLLDGFPPAIRDTGVRLRQLILQTVPGAAETVRPGWRWVAYSLPDGRRVRNFAWIGPERKHIHLGFENGTLLADRDLSGRGIKVEMFGATRRMPAGPAMLALSTGAPIVVVGCYQTTAGWRAIVRPLPMPEPTADRKTDARAITQRIAEAFERLIAAAPAEWHVFQPGWSSED